VSILADLLMPPPRPLSDRAAKAFDFAQDTSKQQITLATGVLALTLTFVKDIAPADTSRTTLQFAWILYVVSVLAGVATLMALTGNVADEDGTGGDSIYSAGIKLFAIVQVLTFVAALGLTVWFGFKAA
jgi:hypothetical protein